MTLREALDVLHRAGRLRSQWLPGMVVTVGARFRAEPPVFWTGRILRVESDGVRFMLAADDREETEVVRLNRQTSREWVERLDTADPATVGCLAALAREATSDPWLHSQKLNSLQWCVRTRNGWGPDEWQGVGDTEGEAWAATMIAMAEVVRRG